MRYFHMAIASGVFSMTSQQTQRTVNREIKGMDLDTLEEICRVFKDKNLTKVAAWTTEPVELDMTSSLYLWFVDQAAIDEGIEMDAWAEENHMGQIMANEWDAAFYGQEDYHMSRDRELT